MAICILPRITHSRLGADCGNMIFVNPLPFQFLNIIIGMNNEDIKFKIDRTAFSVVNREEARQQDIAFWRTKTPLERLAALESLRQTTYGYDPLTTRLQRVFEVVKRK